MSSEAVAPSSTELSARLTDVAGSSAAVLDAYEQAMMATFGRPKRVFVRGEGCYVWDAEGRKYLDLLAGLAVNALGHAHPTVLAAITGQLATLGHVSNFFATPGQVALADRLRSIVGDQSARVFFTNSGTEANEAAFKITRRTGRTKIIACEGAFHGRTMGALAITHNPKYREPFEPLPGDVSFVPYGDVSALAEALSDEVAAFVVEPIQGENGVVVPPDGYLAAARELTRGHGALLWLDEVQTGMGRTGTWLASQGVPSDIVTFAKGLGNGFPIGACVASGSAAGLLGPGSHGSTFGGNPVAAIAGLAVIAVIERDGLLDHAGRAGDRLAAEIVGLQHPLIAGVRGRGLLRAVLLSEPIAAAVSDAALDAGFVINAPRPDVLRLAPPLIVTDAQLDAFVAALPGLLEAARGGGIVTLRHLLADDDLSATEQAAVLDLAAEVKHAPFSRRPYEGPRSVAVLFDKPTLRTQTSFAAGIAELGGFPLIVDARLAGIGKRESVADTARVLGRQAAAIVWRTFAQADLEEMAAYAGVPVVNALTDDYHPCQILADLLTIKESHGSLAGSTLGYLGDGANNMAHSYLLGAALAGMHIRVGAPVGFQPSAGVVARAEELAAETGGSVLITDAPGEAVAGADAIATDTWVSMGKEGDGLDRENTFVPYQLNSSLLAGADAGAVVLHCLPAYRGKEITDEVIEGPQSVVWQEAENRRHVQKAVLIFLDELAGG